MSINNLMPFRTFRLRTETNSPRARHAIDASSTKGGREVGAVMGLRSVVVCWGSELKKGCRGRREGAGWFVLFGLAPNARLNCAVLLG